MTFLRTEAQLAVGYTAEAASSLGVKTKGAGKADADGAVGAAMRTGQTNRGT